MPSPWQKGNMKTIIRILEIVGDPNWVRVEDGCRVYQRIVSELHAENAVDLSFAGRGYMITAFLNAAIGQLYNGDFTPDFLNERFACIDTSDEDIEKINRVTANAKRFYEAKDAYIGILHKELEK